MVTSYDQGMETGASMNIYVVSSCWWRDGATVIGAATDRPGAEAIADRYDTDGDGVSSWAPWRDDRWSSGMTGWRRDALTADGTIHPSLYQEIVCVPLAGSVFPETRDPLAGMRPVGFTDDRPLAHRIAEMREAAEREMDITRAFIRAGSVIGIITSPPAPPPTEILKDAMRMVTQARMDAAADGSFVDQIRIGDGSAKRLFEQAAKKYLPPEPMAPWLADGGLFQGLRVVVDPEMPHNMIRIGQVSYFVDVPSPGQMIRIDAEMLNFTIPPG